VPDGAAQAHALKWFMGKKRRMCRCGHYEGAHPDGPCEFIQVRAGKVRRACSCVRFTEERRAGS
jgi:hypothetical protein